MRVVVMSDSSRNCQDLINALQNSSGTVVVASATSWTAASAYCTNGVADAVVADAASIGVRTADLDAMLAACTARSSSDLMDSSALDNGQTPWDIPQERVYELSSRERDVFRLLGMGLSNRDIAQALGVTEPTVKSHVRQVLAKLSFESRLQAGLAALTHMLREATRRPRRRSLT